MSNVPIGVAILTNGARLNYLQSCINSFLVNCYYRPLVIGIYDNGSTDGTKEWVSGLSSVYGVTWRVGRAETDKGCAFGTNESIRLVSDCEFVVHLESDFEHLTFDLTGEDKMWLNRAVEFMRDNPCDYMYLRRMVNERDIFLHWWSQWMNRIDMEKGNYLRCHDFWWSNNPTLFKPKVLYDCGTLPLNVAIDGVKGTAGWSKPELQAAKPPNTWIHKWGLFVHEKPSYGNQLKLKGCNSGCKYGFFKDGIDRFCACCDKSKGIGDMEAHARRFAGQ